MTSEAVRTEVYEPTVHVGFTDAARVLNERFPDRTLYVTRQQVHVWYTRRERNGFPRRYPVLVPSGKTKPLLHLNAVIDWYETYIPARGGRNRPVGVDNEESAA